MSRLKLYAHTRLPQRAISWLQAAGRRSYKGSPATQRAHSRFAQLNEPRQPGLITMREGIKFLTHEESFESFQWFCWRSPPMIAEYDQFLLDCQNKSVLLDVGACHGVYSLTFLSINPKGRVIAVEPSPVDREILEYNIRVNDLRDRVEIVSYAAGRNNGIMYAAPKWHHLEAQEFSTGAVKVDTKSIDAICHIYSCVPDLIKIDVEGFELHVLDGAKLVLSTRPIVYLEVHPQMAARLGYDHVRCFDRMHEIGYAITEVNGGLITRKEFRCRHHTFFTVSR